jgi:hypothetical protein
MKGLSALDKAGIPLSKDNRDKLEAYSTFQNDAFDNMNRYIKEITGAQMSESEADRLRKAMPDPQRDSPVEFKAKLDRSMVILQRAGNIYKEMLRNGISVDKAERAAADYVLDGMAPRKVLPKAGAPGPDPIGVRAGAAPATPGAAAPPAKAGPPGPKAGAPGPDPIGVR